MSFEQQLISWRRELHQNPELSLQEVATTARIRDWLQSGGLTLLPYDLKTGLVAEVGSGDKVIALRADIDALPIEEATGLPYRSQNQGVMHACGHDIHTSVMLGAALLLKEREAELPNRLKPGLTRCRRKNSWMNSSLIPPLATGQRACTPCACWRRLTTARRC